MAIEHPPYRILVVDPNDVQRRRIADLLAAWNHDAVAVPDWMKGLELAQQRPIEMALLDSALPEMERFRPIRAFKEQAPRFLPVILMTDGNDRSTLLAGTEAGADDFLMKPIEPTELQARITSMRRIQQLTTTLERNNAALRDESMTDPLTGLGNRRALEAALGRILAIAQGHALSVMMIDIDHFKALNDRFGHETGDAALQCVAKLLGRALRQDDVVVRFGGEEFVAIMPRCTADRALVAAERLRTLIAAECLPRLTVSIGVATSTSRSVVPDDLLRAADEAVYRAKREGRNCVRRGTMRRRTLTPPEGIPVTWGVAGRRVH